MVDQLLAEKTPSMIKSVIFNARLEQITPRYTKGYRKKISAEDDD